ncbi:MAG: sigma-70 family RNA polymerase sigma factor [Pedobacter sp.]|nr:MAG: sigma-70 family RNA polymerase sigma factor [Pedobacter sp.]
MKDFEELYNRYWKLVFNAAYKRLGDTEKAKDITQDVFVQFLARQQSSPVENIPAYLLISTRNAVFKYLERSGRIIFTTELETDVTDTRSDADAGIRNREFINELNKLIELLPPQQKLIFKLRFDEDLNSVQIAEKLDISPKTVRNQLGKALATLRSSIFFIYFFSILVG